MNKKSIMSVAVVLSLLAATGCESAKNIDSEERPPKQEDRSFVSINEFIDKFGGAMKNSILHIEKKEDVLIFNMELVFSEELKKLLSKTETRFYFNITDTTLNDSWEKNINDRNHFVEADLQKIVADKRYVVTQKKRLQHPLSPEEEKQLLQSENYTLQILDENFQVKFVLVGLDLDMTF